MYRNKTLFTLRSRERKNIPIHREPTKASAVSLYKVDFYIGPRETRPHPLKYINVDIKILDLYIKTL